MSPLVFLHHGDDGLPGEIATTPAMEVIAATGPLEISERPVGISQVIVTSELRTEQVFESQVYDHRFVVIAECDVDPFGRTGDMRHLEILVTGLIKEIGDPLPLVGGKVLGLARACKRHHASRDIQLFHSFFLKLIDWEWKFFEEACIGLDGGLQ
jgi:hypothetical protein